MPPGEADCPRPSLVLKWTGDLHASMTGTGFATPSSVTSVRPRSPSASTAETLVLVALILQIIGAAIFAVGILLVFGLTAIHPFRAAVIVALIAGSILAIAVVFLYFAYEYSYRRIQNGDYAGAQGPTLVIGILSLFLGLVPGILYLVGYVKLGDALREQMGVGLAPGPMYGGYAPVPPAQIACRGCGRVYYVGQFLFCPNCGQKFGP